MEKDTSYYIKIITKVVILLLVIIGIFLTYKVAMFFIPFIIAMLIAAIIEPLIKFFMKYTKMKRKLASIISIILVIVLLGTLMFFLVSRLISEGANILGSLNSTFEDIKNWAISMFNDVKDGNIEISPDVMKTIQDSLGTIIDTLKIWAINLVTGIIGIASSIPNILTNIVITILAVIFICFDKEYLPNAIKSQVPTKWFDKMKQILKEMCSVSFKYIKAEAKLSFICFILVLIGLCGFNLFGLDVQYPITMAVIIGFIDLLPLFGAGAVMVPWAIYLLIMGNMPLAIAVMVLWIIWAVIKQISEPKMVSKEMGMHPIFTLIGMYAGSKLMGVLGLILGPIILLIIKNIFSELIKKGVLKSFFEME